MRDSGDFFVGRLPLWTIGLFPILPCFVLTLRELLLLHGLPQVPDQFLPALTNSLINGIVASSIGLAISLELSFDVETISLFSVLILLLLFIPGSLLAPGYNFIDGILVKSHLASPSRGLFLIVALTGYILPYQAVILILGQMNISSSERRAVAEYMTSFKRHSYIAGRIRPSLVSAWCVGVFLATTEVPRSQILYSNFYGFGSQMLGPLIDSRLHTGGFNSMYFVMAMALYLAACISLATLKAAAR